MTHLTPADLDRLDALHRDATPGPWYAHNPDDSHSMNAIVVSTFRNEPNPEIEGERSTIVAATLLQSDVVVAHKMEKWWEDADLIAALRNAYPQLAAEIRRLRAENERLLAVRDVAAKVERCRGGDMPNENIIESRLLDELRTTLDAARGGA